MIKKIFNKSKTLSPFVHMSRVFSAKLSTDEVPLSLSTLSFPRLGGNAEPQKSKYIGVRYIPPNSSQTLNLLLVPD